MAKHGPHNRYLNQITTWQCTEEQAWVHSTAAGYGPGARKTRLKEISGIVVHLQYGKQVCNSISTLRVEISSLVIYETMFISWSQHCDNCLDYVSTSL